MHYESYSTEDFIRDEFFRQWVIFPNEETARFWADFILRYPLQHAKIEEARDFLLAMDFSRDVPDSVLQGVKRNFNKAIDQIELSRSKAPNPRAEEQKSKPSGKSAFFKVFYPVAASFLLVAMLVGYGLFQDKGKPEFLSSLTKVEKTPKGKQRHFVLEDGTNVWLNANSKLEYARNFSEKRSREVYLEGEAFFDVTEDKKRPFIVNTSDLAIKVLGTAFNVRSYAGDGEVETTLVRGKVVISTDDETKRLVTLLPNQTALFTKDSKKIALEKTVNTGDYTAWKNGMMVFDNKPFGYIKATLERWYDVSITLEDQNSLSCTFSGKFKDKSLQEVLEIFKTTESINYVIEGDRVAISGKLCQN